MVIHTLNALKDNFVYVIAANDGACAVVDPGGDLPRIHAAIAQAGVSFGKVLARHQAIQQMIAELGLSGVLFTADALHCQKNL